MIKYVEKKKNDSIENSPFKATAGGLKITRTFPELSHKLLITFKHLVKPHAITRGFDYHNKSNPNHLPSCNARRTEIWSKARQHVVWNIYWRLEYRHVARWDIQTRCKKICMPPRGFLYSIEHGLLSSSVGSGAPIYIWKSSPLTLVNNRDPVTREIKPW